MAFSALVDLISALFESKTILPSYKSPHIIYTIMLIGSSKEGLGRYKIKKMINLGEGSTKTLLSRMKDEDIIEVEDSRQKGHSLTHKGLDIYNQLIDSIPIPQEFTLTNQKYVLGEIAYYTRLKSEDIDHSIPIGIQQRDEAIKLGGSGATAILLKSSTSTKYTFSFPDNPNFTLEMEKTLLNLPRFNLNDVLVLGGAKDKSMAILATIAASLSLLNIRDPIF